MERRSIGSLSVTVVGVGTNNFGFGMTADEVPAVVNAALDAGINIFDTADVYGDSEQRLGRAIGRRRDDVVIATKFGNPVDDEVGTGGAHPKYVRTAVEASLRRLGTDRIDLLQLHVPDPTVPIVDTLGALGELVAAGKVREVGCSNFSAEQVRETHAAASFGTRFVSVQNHYNLLHRDDEADVIPVCRELGIAYLPYFPLASGMLTGKYSRGRAPAPGTRLDRWGAEGAAELTDDAFDKVESLSSWAAERGRTVLEVAYSWLISDPIVASVTAGATSARQVKANVAASGWVLTPEERAQVDELTLGSP